MLKNLKSLFIVEEPEDDKKKVKKEEVTKTPNKQESTTTNTSTVSRSTTTTNTTGVVDAKIVEKLLQAIEANNLEGFDYLEFKKAIKALEKIPMDEATKYRSTFATASTMGVTLDKLLQTVKHYIAVLDKENNTFLKAFEGQLAQKVGSKEQEITQFDSIIKEKSEKIKQLTQEITKHQQQIAALRKVVDESKSKINKTQNDFKISYLNLRSQFEQDVEKMKQYLK